MVMCITPNLALSKLKAMLFLATPILVKGVFFLHQMVQNQNIK